METLVIISIFINGVTFGILALDFLTRKGLQLELRGTLADIARVHNQLTTQVAEVSSRIDTHEMRLSGFKK